MAFQQGNFDLDIIILNIGFVFYMSFPSSPFFLAGDSWSTGKGKKGALPLQVVCEALF